MKITTFSPLFSASLALVLTGCGSKEESRVAAGKFTIIDTLTDGADKAKAKRNALNTLSRFGDEVDGMVGLWAYNAPQCINALRERGLVGEVKVFSFDEDEATLQAIKDGEIEGTIVQNPYEFGYRSMEFLTRIVKGEPVEVPDDKMVEVPAREITGANVDAFWTELKEKKAKGEAAADIPKKEGDFKFAFVINTADPFWSYARAGCATAEEEFGITVDFETPHDASTLAQNRILENILNKGDYDGVAITPLNPDNQTEILNQVAAAMPLICHDSDAPKSNRRFYLGTLNYNAGRMLGKLVKERMPDGGNLMVYVGKMDMLNAQERRQGLIDELAEQ